MKAGDGCSRTGFGLDHHELVSPFLAVWGLGLHQPGTLGPRENPTWKDHRLRFSSRAQTSVGGPIQPNEQMTVERTLLSFLRLPIWPSPPFLRLTPSTCRKEGAKHSRASHSPAKKEESGSESTGTSQLLVVEVGLFRPHPLLPSGLLSFVFVLFFFKTLLFVFNIVIFCLTLYYSCGYYSLYHCSESWSLGCSRFRRLISILYQFGYFGGSWETLRRPSSLPSTGLQGPAAQSFESLISKERHKKDL